MTQTNLSHSQQHLVENFFRDLDSSLASNGEKTQAKKKIPKLNHELLKQKIDEERDQWLETSVRQIDKDGRSTVVL